MDGGSFAFWTSSAAGKAKRLANSPRVTVVASDSRGRVKAGATPVEGTATMLTSGAQYDEIVARIKKKYGFGVPMSRLFWTMSHLGKGGKYPYGDVVVLITPNP